MEESWELSTNLIYHINEKSDTNWAVCPVIWYQNVCSLVNKIPEIEVYINSLNGFLPILCFAEHWMTPPVENNLQISGYYLSTAFCRINRKGGGTGIYMPTSIKCKVRSDLQSFSVESICELSAVDFEFNSIKYTLLVIYRSPSADFYSFLCIFDCVMLSLSVKDNIIICGDYNVDFLVDHSFMSLFMNLLARHYLKYMVNSPTRYSSSCATCIDNILIRSYNIDFDVKLDFNGISDHAALLLSSNLALNKESSSFIYEKRAMDEWSLFNLYNMLCINLYSFNSEGYDDVNVAFNDFHTVFVSCFNTCCPKKTVSIKAKRSNAWITDRIRVLRKIKMSFYKNYKERNDELSKRVYKNFMKFYKGVLVETKQSYYNNVIEQSKHKGKSLWKIVNSLTRAPHVNNNIHIKEDGLLIVNPQDVAEAFNKFFVTASNELLRLTYGDSLKDHNCKLPLPQTSSMYWSPVSEDEVKEIVLNCNNKTSTGFDDIPMIAVKACVDIIAKPLTDIFNSSFKLGVYPNLMKISKVIAIHKKGDVTDKSNFRPIALSSCFAKIFETLVKRRLVCYLETFNIFCENQYGFIRGKSTLAAVISYIEVILNSIDSRECNGTVYCDMTKAFDLVCHHKLLMKMENYGIRGVVLQWFESYLSDRSQYVVVTHSEGSKRQSYSSSHKNVSVGVPQGSVLGPILFLLYVNDLCINVPDATIVMFADDFTLLNHDSDFINMEFRMNSSISQLRNWLEANGLIMNASKTNVMSINARNNGKEQSVPCVLFNDCKLNESNCTKFLGIWVDKYLNWHDHVDKLANRLSSACFMIRVVRECIGLNAAMSVYFAHFESILRYGILLWGNSSYLNYIRVFRIQKKALRIIANVDYRHTCRNLFKQMSIMTLASLYIYEAVLYVKCNLSKFPANNNVHSHNTRTWGHLHRYNCRLGVKHNSIFVVGIKLYNNLPLFLRNINDLLKFKLAVKKFFSVNSFYDVNEFLEM